MSEYILQIAIGLVIALIAWIWRDYTGKVKDLESKLNEMNIKCPGYMECERHFNRSIDSLATELSSKMLTEEKLEKLLKKHFDSFELRLMKESMKNKSRRGTTKE